MWHQPGRTSLGPLLPTWPSATRTRTWYKPVRLTCLRGVSGRGREGVRNSVDGTDRKREVRHHSFKRIHKYNHNHQCRTQWRCEWPAQTRSARTSGSPARRQCGDKCAERRAGHHTAGHGGGRKIRHVIGCFGLQSRRRGSWSHHRSPTAWRQ